jgi:hypothetical protein
MVLAKDINTKYEYLLQISLQERQLSNKITWIADPNKSGLQASYSFWQRVPS